MLVSVRISIVCVCIPQKEAILYCVYCIMRSKMDIRGGLPKKAWNYLGCGIPHAASSIRRIMEATDKEDEFDEIESHYLDGGFPMGAYDQYLPHEKAHLNGDRFVAYFHTEAIECSCDSCGWSGHEFELLSSYYMAGGFQCVEIQVFCPDCKSRVKKAL